MADSQSFVGTAELAAVERQIASLKGEVAAVGAGVAAVTTIAQSTQQELTKLRDDFNRLINEQRRTAALQQASTELINVRQEMEQKFGNFRMVRNSMIGILQATDAALVRETTISNVSEELLITTHDYWLAPVLVAVAAWISNDHDLADRAIREAMKRDKEHTSLVMALICRRNNRIQTCYEWLSRYFQTQDASNMDEDAMVYIDAYINGVFGPDEKHMCDDYISRWIDEVRGTDSNFDEEQSETWEAYFTRFNQNEEEKYPALKRCAKEFGYIDAYLSRVDAVGPISENFDRIRRTPIDQEALRREVDQKLVTLVNSDDPAERQLRRQEEYLMAVKACDGDVEAARNMVRNQQEAKKKKRMDIISQLTHVISDDKPGTKERTSVKKTAVSFLRGYINRGFDRYMTEKQEAFPEQITIGVNGWTGSSADGQNAEALKADYRNYLAAGYAKEETEDAKRYNSKPLLVTGVVLLILGVILCIVMLPLGIASLIGCIGAFAGSYKKKKDGEKAAASRRSKYSSLDASGSAEIDSCLGEWRNAKGTAVQAMMNRKKEVA